VPPYDYDYFNQEEKKNGTFTMEVTQGAESSSGTWTARNAAGIITQSCKWEGATAVSRWAEQNRAPLAKGPIAGAWVRIGFCSPMACRPVRGAVSGQKFLQRVPRRSFFHAGE
jgi:hypothetical protein